MFRLPHRQSSDSVQNTESQLTHSTQLLLGWALIVGSVSENLISIHKNLTSAYDENDYKLLLILLQEFGDIVCLPHVLAEASNLLRQGMKEPVKRRIQIKFQEFIQSTEEMQIESFNGVRRSEFLQLGLTDAMLLYLGAMQSTESAITLLTSDTVLADIALSQGNSVIDYKREFSGGT